VAQRLPEGLTGADLGAVTSAAYEKATKRKLRELRRQALGDCESVGEDELSSQLTHSVDIEEELEDGSDSDLDYLDDEEALWKIRQYLSRVEVERLQVVVTMADLLFAADKAQPTVYDTRYYSQLEAEYNDAG
jgi:SpoVK/Ycf46/Vps4 family AAA+-type ATPase